MGLEYKDGIVEMTPGIIDVHGHGRVFDPLPMGKAGLADYTETALKCGIVRINLMPNEAYRIGEFELTNEENPIQFPISNGDRARIMEMAIRTQSRMETGFNVGLQRSEAISADGKKVNRNALLKNFSEVGENPRTFKIWVDESTGGQNVPVEHAPEIVQIWYQIHPDIPVTAHAEDANVRNFLEAIDELPEGKDIPIHIAHISSKEELLAVIEAKERGMNVTCEVTPHHLFATADEGEQINGYGCMKPGLKTAEDVKFLWDNMEHIDIIASDCAPHRPEEKEAGAWGVTNHTVMMPLLFGAVEEGRLSLEDLYQKMVVKPHERFNIPLDGSTQSVFDLNDNYLSVVGAELEIAPAYGQNMFEHLERIGRSYHLAGKLVFAQSGKSYVKRNDQGLLETYFEVSLDHLIKQSRT